MRDSDPLLTELDEKAAAHNQIDAMRPPEDRGDGSRAVAIARVARSPPAPRPEATCASHMMVPRGAADLGSQAWRSALPPQVLLGYSLSQAETALDAVGKNDSKAAIAYLQKCAPHHMTPDVCPSD